MSKVVGLGNNYRVAIIHAALYRTLEAKANSLLISDLAHYSILKVQEFA
jgi:hypothetical protein